jgi:phage major head subunit gpT-like protein
MGHDADLYNALKTVNTSFNTIADDLYSQDLPGAYQAYTQIVPANGLSQYRFDFGGATPRAREWLGSKEYKQFRAYTQTLSMKYYEKTIAIKREELKYDGGANVVAGKIGQFLSGNLGEYDKLGFAALVANGTGFDGVALFHASHPHGNTTNSNTGTSTLSKANLDATILAMKEWQNEHAEPMGVNPTTMICGPSNEMEAKELLETGDRLVPIDTTGTEATSFVIGVGVKQNIYQGTMKLIIDPRFSDGTRDEYWYLVDESKPQKPIICVEGDKPHPVKQDDPTDDRNFNFREMAYSVEFDCVFGPGFWWTIYRQAATS